MEVAWIVSWPLLNVATIHVPEPVNLFCPAEKQGFIENLSVPITGIQLRSPALFEISYTLPEITDEIWNLSIEIVLEIYIEHWENNDFIVWNHGNHLHFFRSDWLLAFSHIQLLA